MLAAISVLLALSWAMSLAFVFSLGVGYGHKQAHTQRNEFVNTVRDGFLAIVEKVKNVNTKSAAQTIAEAVKAEIAALNGNGGYGLDRLGLDVPAQEKAEG